MSSPTSLINVDGGYALSQQLRLSTDVFNALNASVSDIDYFYVSRLRGEPESHLHPTLPRAARLTLTASF